MDMIPAGASGSIVYKVSETPLMDREPVPVLGCFRGPPGGMGVAWAGILLVYYFCRCRTFRVEGLGRVVRNDLKSLTPAQASP